jgi:hypothetical protein
VILVCGSGRTTLLAITLNDVECIFDISLLCFPFLGSNYQCSTAFVTNTISTIIRIIYHHYLNSH